MVIGAGSGFRGGLRSACRAWTPDALTTVSGLTPLTTVGFRVAVTKTKSPMSKWSQVFEFLVH